MDVPANLTLGKNQDSDSPHPPANRDLCSLTESVPHNLPRTAVIGSVLESVLGPSACEGI